MATALSARRARIGGSESIPANIVAGDSTTVETASNDTVKTDPVDTNAMRAEAGDAGEDAARDRLVELEFIAGIESPADDRQRRMNYQVQRLASRMRDRAAASPEAELAVLLAAWFAQAPQPDALESRFLRAADAAVASLP
jgi:hypothetical protein